MWSHYPFIIENYGFVQSGNPDNDVTLPYAVTLRCQMNVLFIILAFSLRL